VAIFMDANTGEERMPEGTERIRPEETAEVANLLFGEGRWTGPMIAESVGEKHHTLWSWFNRRGLPADVALRLAQEMDRRATALIRAAGVLRRLATAAQGRSTDSNRQAPVE
jgi:hypothetical protein